MSSLGHFWSPESTGGRTSPAACWVKSLWMSACLTVGVTLYPTKYVLSSNPFSQHACAVVHTHKSKPCRWPFNCRCVETGSIYVLKQLMLVNVDVCRFPRARFYVYSVFISLGKPCNFKRMKGTENIRCSVTAVFYTKRPCITSSQPLRVS